MRIVPEVVLPSRLKRFFPYAAVMIVGAVLCALAVQLASDAGRSRVQSVYLPELKAHVRMLRTDPHRGPTLVRACLYDRNFRCDDRWVPYDAIDVIAKRKPRRGEALVLGCVYVHRDKACACERHDFLLPLSHLR